MAGHFGLYTGLLVTWVLVAGTVYAWPWLHGERRAGCTPPLLAGLAGAAGAVLIIFLVITVNINLVKADIVYKQGQQFDQQGNWLSSIELYRRALATRQTEDQYMLFLGRALLEQAKQAQGTGTYQLPKQPTLNDVLELNPDEVARMSQGELLQHGGNRAAGQRSTSTRLTRTTRPTWRGCTARGRTWRPATRPHAICCREHCHV